jgi:outer membrane protein OmpA-like peptidoglycan-associated protein
VLSEHRADSVKRYLVGRGVQSARLTSTGRGENAPVADNESLAGRQQNRRVEVVISEAAGSAKIGK